MSQCQNAVPCACKNRMFSENQPERGVGWRFEGEWRALARPTAELVAALAVCDGSRQNIREKRAHGIQPLLCAVCHLEDSKLKIQDPGRH